MTKTARPLKKAWREVHEIQTALTSEDIEEGAILRTMKYAKKKDRKDPLRYVYGIVMLKPGSKTEIAWSYNFSMPDQWASGGQINPDNGHIAFFPAREEHKMVAKMLLNYKTFQDRAKCLSAELDFQCQRNIVLINERDRLKDQYTAALQMMTERGEYVPPMHETTSEHWLNILLFPLKELYGRIRKCFGR